MPIFPSETTFDKLTKTKRCFTLVTASGQAGISYPTSHLPRLSGYSVCIYTHKFSHFLSPKRAQIELKQPLCALPTTKDILQHVIRWVRRRGLTASTAAPMTPNRMPAVDTLWISLRGYWPPTTGLPLSTKYVVDLALDFGVGTQCGKEDNAVRVGGFASRYAISRGSREFFRSRGPLSPMCFSLYGTRCGSFWLVFYRLSNVLVELAIRAVTTVV